MIIAATVEPQSAEQKEKDAATALAETKTAAAKAKQKQAVLDKLGITADEAALLFG